MSCTRTKEGRTKRLHGESTVYICKEKKALKRSLSWMSPSAMHEAHVLQIISKGERSEV